MPHRQPNWLDRSGGGAGGGKLCGGRVVVCGAGVAREWEAKEMNKCPFSHSKTAPVTGEGQYFSSFGSFSYFFFMSFNVRVA